MIKNHSVRALGEEPVQLGVNNSIVSLSSNAQLPECFAADYALIRHLDQGTEKKHLSIYLRRETLVYSFFEFCHQHRLGHRAFNVNRLVDDGARHPLHLVLNRQVREFNGLDHICPN